MYGSHCVIMHGFLADVFCLFFICSTDSVLEELEEAGETLSFHSLFLTVVVKLTNIDQSVVYAYVIFMTSVCLFYRSDSHLKKVDDKLLSACFQFLASLVIQLTLCL